MCAIAGVMDLPCSWDIMDKMLASMRRRGPDGDGTFQHKDRTLLHARLAIVDPRGGSQPMTLSWGPEEYVLVYNGELYNTEEVRKELRKEGHRFAGHGDTEVLLHAYAQWGKNCLEYVNGIFAFAVLEKSSGRVFLARDRIGVKPLFYTLHRGGLIFASEIKTILCWPTVEPGLDELGAAQLLMLGPGRLPGSGVFHGICEVEPGCCGYYEDGKLKLERYWQLRDRVHTDSFSDTVEKVRALVTDAILRQTVSDVPLGTFLSGGLDSSIITSICADKIPGLKTFSVDYVDHEKHFVPGKFQPQSDSHFIRRMTEAVHTAHYWTVLSPEDVFDALQDATLARDLPGMADVDFSLLAFCREIRREVKVALSGECADEIFGGYPWYRDPEVRAMEGFPWAQNTKQRLAMLHPDLRSRINGEELVMDCYRQTCRESHILPENTPQERRMKEMVNLNFRWFMQTLLDRKDRMSMYSGLEVRVPFCDHRIAEYLYAVPWEYKDHSGKEKGLLRKAMEGVVPNEILWRKKSPYPKTFDPKYTEFVECGVKTLLSDPSSPVFSLVDRSQAEKLFHTEPIWPWYGQLMRVPQTMAYLLQLDYWLRHYRVKILF